MDFGLERALEARCWTANGGDNGYKQRIAQAPELIDIHNAQDAEPHSACRRRRLVDTRLVTPPVSGDHGGRTDCVDTRVNRRLTRIL